MSVIELLDTNYRKHCGAFARCLARSPQHLRIVVAVLVMALAFDSHAGGGSFSLQIDASTRVTFTPVVPVRTTPWLYFDQGIASVPAMYPNGKILTGHRLETIKRGNKSLLYSLIVYVETADDQIADASGQLLSAGRAWYFAAELPVDRHVELTDQLIHLLEEVAFRYAVDN